MTFADVAPYLAAIGIPVAFMAGVGFADWLNDMLRGVPGSPRRERCDG